jgi:predicted ATP-dependent endonuclease of OLD family
MKSGKITFKNYRNIPFDNPITLEIKQGITFILGINNIGKSNILKFFYEFNGLKDFINQPIVNQIAFGTKDSIPVSQILNQKNHTRDLEIKLDVNNVIFDFKFKPQNNDYSSLALSGTCTKQNSEDQTINSEELGVFTELFSNTLYIGSFRNASFNSTGTYYNIQIGTQFVTTWNQWANGQDAIKRNKISELVNELKELFDFAIFEISVNPESTKMLIRNENGSFYLDELGGGISHFIIVLGNALIQEPSFVLIDEPENALHPKLQQTFVTALASKSKYGLIATSHSIGLARSVADNIYHLGKNEKNNRLSLEDFGKSYKPTLMNSLNELGYSQFVEIGGNNILLVEGRTDIKSFKEILKKYKIEHHFILIDLGGSNFINGDSYEELEELKRLNAKSYSVIFDSEISQEGEEMQQKFKDFKSNCEKLNFNIFETEFHSTENYITQKAINKVIGPNYPVLGKYESLESPERKENNTKWGKSDNWKMFKEMTKDDFIGTKLDVFIMEKLYPQTGK